jgi:hypothetical protein
VAGSHPIVHQGSVPDPEHHGRSAGVARIWINDALSGTVPQTGERVVVSELLAAQFDWTRRFREVHWLQFVWNQLTVTTNWGSFPLAGLVGSASLGSVAGPQTSLTVNSAEPQWGIDIIRPQDQLSRSPRPWYEQRALAAEGPSSLTMYDSPGGTESLPAIRSVIAQNRARGVIRAADTVYQAVLSQHFETYLVVRDADGYHVVYRVPWTASTIVDNPDPASASGYAVAPAVQPRTYSIGNAGPVGGLPEHLRRREVFGDVSLWLGLFEPEVGRAHRRRSTARSM